MLIKNNIINKKPTKQLNKIMQPKNCQTRCISKLNQRWGYNSKSIIKNPMRNSDSDYVTLYSSKLQNKSTQETLGSYVRADLGDGYGISTNLKYSWMWGSLCGIFLVIQLVTGILLSMHYIPTTAEAFWSIEGHIMRNVHRGWLIRYMHSNGASFYFISIYMHIGKNLYYRLYINNRVVWLSGLVIFLLSMAAAFLGYVLPWGQMSYWGATVITNLFSSIPIVGADLVNWMWGGYSVGGPTLSRFFSLHFVIPFIISAFVIVHLFFLHKGSASASNMITTDDVASFYPYAILKDLQGILGVIWIYSFFVFFYPNALGHPDNYIEANPLVTPKHIVPEWYFLPFYAILRVVPDKLFGTVLMGGAILLFAILPFLIVTPKEHNQRFSIVDEIFFWVFSSNFVFLGWLGAQPIEFPYIGLAILSTFLYFGYFFFLIIPPIWEKIFK